MAHTPGPWHIGKRCILTRGPHGAGAHIVEFSSELPEEQERSNHLLIAAAPDMLAALIAITDQLERIGDLRPHKDGHFVDEARAVIAKATGAA